MPWGSAEGPMQDACQTPSAILCHTARSNASLFAHTRIL